MWRMLERGCQWSGLVKSRCKNGDDDWVLDSVTPVIGLGEWSATLACARRGRVREQLRIGHHRIEHEAVSGGVHGGLPSS
ncbi:hypothetical protein [Mycetohabitans sp. B2]|uniref:hypothetical protein n=1 Tax=Mycetohabitans sp. B2 TaxID=2841274 RepID=UPI00301AD2B4